MSDLHAWLTAQVDQVETIASEASMWGGDWYFDDFVNEIRDRPNSNTITAAHIGAHARHIAANDPAAILRRCAADRRILARHCMDPRCAGDPIYATACEGCGTYGDGYEPRIDNINDCPELLDLAHAHGITDDILAGLDRPVRSEIKPWEYQPRPADVPPGLRGPNWKRRP